MGSLNKIDHIVVLMLENRSFNCMLGRLYPTSAGFDGLQGNETNPDTSGAPVEVWSGAGTTPDIMRTPDPDPGELWTDMNLQIFGTGDVSPLPEATMKGFVRSYQQQTAQPPESYKPASVMHYFTPKQVPVISSLGEGFGVAIVACLGAVPNVAKPFFRPYGDSERIHEQHPPFIFLTRCRASSIGSSDKRTKLAGLFPRSAPSRDAGGSLVGGAAHFRLFDDEFEADARNGNLPNYSFIEPRYFASVICGLIPNDEHPPHNVVYGEQLIARVYNAVRSAPTWKKTLLVITYDEHGGCYDHVPPPRAVPPTTGRHRRVRLRPLRRPRSGGHHLAVYPPQHRRSADRAASTAFRSTTPRSSRPCGTLFGLGPPLTRRDAVAPDLDGALPLAEPENPGPSSIDVPPYVPSPAEVAVARQRPPNDMQKALLHLAAHLPDSAAAVPQHIALLQKLKGADQQIVANVKTTVGDAAHVAKSELGKLFATL